MVKSPEQRSSNLFAYFGYQGGTIHQIAQETGVDAQTLLYAEPKDGTYLSSLYSLGSSALETCTLNWRRNTLAPQHHGQIDYWLGVADAFEVCKG